MPIASVNPATGETLRAYDALSDAQLDERIAAAVEAFWSYRRTTFAERSAWMAKAADVLDKDRERFARTMTAEMGKPIRAAREEAAKCAWVCRYYAEHAERMLAPRDVPIGEARGSVCYQPLGVVLAVMPWNFPFWQVFRFAAPGLMAGNVGLLKHASNVPECALQIEEVFQRAGFPAGTFQTLLIGSDRVAGVIADPRVEAVTLTGSEGAGSRVAGEAGARIKKTVMELGGSDPFVVMPSADLDQAAATAVRARMVNNGQSCIAAKRFIVHEAIADAFVERFVTAVVALKVGDPMDEATDVGPLATADIRDGLEEQVRRTVAAGARVLCGGRSLPGPGYYYAPTVLVDVPDGSPAADEELFGPVASIWRVADIGQAIARANATRFGLGSAAWTREPAEVARFVDELQAGMVFINGMVASDPRLPFGGVKRSGYGRELGDVGIHEFVNVKTVWMRADAFPNVTGTE